MTIPVAILAGGLGTRLGEETKKKPKPMINIGKDPIILHIINIYKNFNHNEFLIAGGYKINVIKQYVKKGVQVYIEGQLTTRKWTDEKSGQDKYSTEIILQGYNSTFTILSGKNNKNTTLQDSSETKSVLPNENNNVASGDLDDEIPF